MEPIRSLELDQIDLSDLGFWARPWAEREGAFELLRRERPMPFFEEPELGASIIEVERGSGYRALMRHRDVVEVSRHPEIYLSGPGAISIQDLPPEMVEYFSGMISTDNPRHARLRRIVSSAFNPRMIKSIEESIQQQAEAVIASIAERGSCDFVTEVAAALPLAVICNMMGIAPSQYADVFRCTNVILSTGDPEFIPEGEDVIMAFLNAGAELTAMMNELGAYRQQHPTDDLTSALVNGNVDGEALTQAEMASLFVLLVVAGNETTRTAISHGLLAMTEYPEQRQRWQENFEELAPSAVEEIVRWASPVIFMRRTVGEDVELSGQQLKAGDKLLLFYNSANRDEEVFEDPYRFDLGRTPNPHLGFGAAGPHFCLGAHLARREIAVMFRELFSTLPDIESVGPPSQLRSNFINGIKHLDCRFTPVASSR